LTHLELDMTDPRVTLVSLAKKISEKGLTISIGGNISTSLPDMRILITPSKQHKTLSELDVNDLSVVSLSGELIQGPKPSAELPMHIAIHSAAQGNNWVIHAHPPMAVAYASEKTLPEQLFVESSRLRFSLVGLKSPGSEELAKAVVEKIREGSNAILLEGHGVVVVSNYANDAVLLLEELENLCKTDLARHILKSSR